MFFEGEEFDNWGGNNYFIVIDIDFYLQFKNSIGFVKVKVYYLYYLLKRLISFKPQAFCDGLHCELYSILKPPSK